VNKGEKLNISRFCGTAPLEYTMEFLSPAFLGGANQDAELRSAPFKAALRWWWRVLYGNKKTPKQLWKDERRIFGSTENASALRIFLSGEVPAQSDGFPNGRKIPVTSSSGQFSINILDYLAYGLCAYEKNRREMVYNRSHLVTGQKFKLSVSVPSEFKNEIQASINALLAFGSVGSRSRNGFGSLCSVGGLAPVSYPVDWTKSNPVEYPSLNSKSKLFVTKQTYNTWGEALSETGIAYRNARTCLEGRNSFERRGFVSRPIENKFENIPGNIKEQRSPKQFILHISKQNNKYIGQILSLPIVFYEKGAQEKYNNVIDAMHKCFVEPMDEKTGDINTRMGTRP
jgi:CRISPR-associated protein Cmr1